MAARNNHHRRSIARWVQFTFKFLDKKILFQIVKFLGTGSELDVKLLFLLPRDTIITLWKKRNGRSDENVIHLLRCYNDFCRLSCFFFSVSFTGYFHEKLQVKTFGSNVRLSWSFQSHQSDIRITGSWLNMLRHQFFIKFLLLKSLLDFHIRLCLPLLLHQLHPHIKLNEKLAKVRYFSRCK